jgi:outer membrane autotransporter protein
VRDTDVGSNTVFVYGQYKPTAWYMNAMLNYTMSDYVEKSDVLGTLVESDYDVNAFGGAIMTGYDFAGGITPEMGVRYMHISADEYKNSLDIKSKLDDVDYLTGMLGAKYAFDYRVSRWFALRPELRGAAKFDVISDENVATINMPGINAYVLDGKRLARMGAEFGAGLVMKYNDFSLALNYDIELREDYTSQTGRVRARLVF